MAKHQQPEFRKEDAFRVRCRRTAAVVRFLFFFARTTVPFCMDRIGLLCRPASFVFFSCVRDTCMFSLEKYRTKNGHTGEHCGGTGIIASLSWGWGGADARFYPTALIGP
ncbi:hypothetical protein [Pandoravirus japonicus]|uniref:Uncharacterized protein n=1 Tax=Pandoravirus japonicus TaxID=2823154 RepID=A0A811BPS1_9VIRU|nr:hypothetical protein [Pandoravirus japonicus]